MTAQRLVPAAVSALLCLASAAVAGEAPPPPTAADLNKAVATMRKVKPADFETDEKRKAKTQQVHEAWQTLMRGKAAGAARLKQELATIDAAKERDDYFKLGAAALLWQIGELDEAKTIAGIWAGDVDLAFHYHYVFHTALAAARTQDQRALPMLMTVLRDRKGTIFVEQHFLRIAWPHTHEFLWGAFGAKGLPVLNRLLDESTDANALAAATRLLGKAHYLPSLEKIQRLAREGQGDVRAPAVGALGEYGHPDDFGFLLAGLKSDDPNVAAPFEYALFEYGDLRAVPQIIGLLNSPNPSVRAGIIMGVRQLLTPELLEAVRSRGLSAGDARERKACTSAVATILRELDLTAETYASKSQEEKGRLLASLREKREAEYLRKPDDREFTHADLLKAAAEWMKNHRITGGTYEWVEDRHVLAAATPADIPLLLDVKAKCYPRVSDECLVETYTLDILIRRLGRSRYRKGVGVCEKVEAP